MADTDLGEETLGEAELVEGLEKKKISGKKIILAVGGVLLLVLVVLGVMSLFGGGDANQEPSEDMVLDQIAANADLPQDNIEQDMPPEKLKLMFYTLPDQLFNLNTAGQGNSFLRARITLEVDRESYKADLEAKMPRILDEFHNYIRELRREDVEGSAGFARIKEELLMRINQAVAPTRVKDVLFEEFLIQG